MSQNICLHVLTETPKDLKDPQPECLLQQTHPRQDENLQIDFNQKRGMNTWIHHEKEQQEHSNYTHW